MKKIITTSFFWLAMAGIGFAQQIKLNKDTSGFLNAPMYLVKVAGNAKTFTMTPVLGLVNQKDIASMEILKGKTADLLYGAKGKNGVVIITLTATTKIFTADELLDTYNIRNNDRVLPLYIDYNLSRNTKDLAFTLSNIKSVNVAVEEATDLKYISIITTDYPNSRIRDRQMHLRGSDTDSN